MMPPASAQRGRWRSGRQRQVADAAQMRKANPNRAGMGKSAPPSPRAMAGLPPKWVENLRDMSPEEQERFMHNNERFQSLPPQRQEQIRRNLQRWNSLPPEQQNRIRATERMLEQATPEQREHFRNDIVPKLQQMAPERRMRVLNHWRRLQAMTPAEQQAALRDPTFMGNLSPDEQSIVGDLNSLGNHAPQ
jgi:hypothetical protein